MELMKIELTKSTNSRKQLIRTNSRVIPSSALSLVHMFLQLIALCTYQLSCFVSKRCSDMTEIF